MNEGAITPARYDEGTLDINHNAATGGTGYHTIMQIMRLTPGNMSYYTVDHTWHRSGIYLR